MAEKNPAPHDVAYYLDKVPGAHSDKPKYTAMLSMLLKPFVEAQALASLLFTNFDLDNAVGVQLDVVGKIVGRSREITTPVEDIWFSFGGDGSRGFGRGVWKRPGDPDALPGVSDMSMTIGVSGKIPNLLYLFLLVQDLISVKPGGVKVRYMITSVNRTPLFGFGVQNEYVSGFGSGSWGTTPDNL